MNRPRYAKLYPGHKSLNYFGNSRFVVVGGPCSVDETFPDLAAEIAPMVTGFRGGVFKARTSPYTFSGLGAAGVELVLTAGKRFNRPTVVEALSQEHLRALTDIDVIQIGARNMYNYPLLREAGLTGKIILLKRHFSATIDELLLAAEHILAVGNQKVILCERGIRTFESRYRSTLDITGVVLLKQLTHLPVWVDPSHAAGDSSLIEPLILASAAAGADGVIVEVHLNPAQACSDAAQAITPKQLAVIRAKLEKILPIV